MKAAPNPPPGDRGRIAPLAVLPVFFALRGRPVLVAGGCDAAAWKAELLAAAGASVLVETGAPGPAMRGLIARLPAGTVTLRGRSWGPASFAGMALAVGAFAGEAEARAFRHAAQAAGIPVNVVDRPAFCDFSFGGIVNRSPLVIGIATDGAAPAFGQQIRARIEALLPASLAAWAMAARNFRPKVAARGLSGAACRGLWSRFAAMALDKAGPPDLAGLDTLLAGDMDRRAGARQVILVGAGPGVPDLLTLKAVRTLLGADVIAHDGRVPECLEVARREARRLDLGGMKAEAIAALLARLARRDAAVVFLVQGDPHANPLAAAVSARLAAMSLSPAIVAGIPLPGDGAKHAGLRENGGSVRHCGLPPRVAAAPFS